MQISRDDVRTQSVHNLWGIGQAYATKLRACGVSTIEVLANHTKLSELTQQSNISITRLRKFQLRARSMLEQEIMQIASFEILPHNVIYLDIETDLTCDKVWLIGLLVHDEVVQLYADNWNEEQGILIQFLRILRQHPTYALASYSGTNFDYRILHQAMQRHQLDTTPLESCRHIDLCLAIRRSFIIPCETFALKAFGAFLRYPFQHPEMDGMLVALQYLRHVESGIPLDPTVIQYNEDDVKVLPYLIDALCSCNQHIKLES